MHVSQFKWEIILQGLKGKWGTHCQTSSWRPKAAQLILPRFGTRPAVEMPEHTLKERQALCLSSLSLPTNSITSAVFTLGQSPRKAE